jgi:hypothetical protein
MQFYDVLAQEIDEIVRRARARLVACERKTGTTKGELKMMRASLARLEAWRNLVTSDRGYARSELPAFFRVNAHERDPGAHAA